MRTLLALMLVMGAVIASNATAQQAMPTGIKSENANPKRAAKAKVSAQHSNQQEQAECERARNEDPTGAFAGYPCWARGVFGGPIKPDASGSD